jgi:hypothetical protein
MYFEVQILIIWNNHDFGVLMNGIVKCVENCETTFYRSTPGSISWLYLKIHMLSLKEKNASVFLDVKLHLWLKPDSLLPMHDLQFRIDKYIFQAWTL